MSEHTCCTTFLFVRLSSKQKRITLILLLLCLQDGLVQRTNLVAYFLSHVPILYMNDLPTVLKNEVQHAIFVQFYA